MVDKINQTLGAKLAIKEQYFCIVIENKHKDFITSIHCLVGQHVIPNKMRKFSYNLTEQKISALRSVV